MDEYADIYFIDERNAVTDHRRRDPRPGAPPAQPWRPSRPAVIVPPPGHGVRPAYTAPAQVVYPQPAVPVAYPQPIIPQGFPPSPLAGLFGRITMGQLIEMIAQGIAAMAQLPTPPTASDSARDNLENLVIYQTALAQHAKRDEQLRTIGSIVGKLV